MQMPGVGDSGGGTEGGTDGTDSRAGISKRDAQNTDEEPSSSMLAATA